ncbi:MAG: amidohydrolase family protein [Thermodesulfobacteriota bacterium]
MRNRMLVLDADAHVVEPAGLFDGGLAVMDMAPNTPMIPCGDASRIEDLLAHGFDAPSYLRAMDAQGIDAVVLYPSMGLFVPFQPELDADASLRACRAYNDWIAGYCATDPGRLFAVGLVPLADPALAGSEARRAADLGLVGVLARPNHLYGRNLGDRAYDPLYATLEERGLVLAVHEGLGVRGPTLGAERFRGFTLRHLCSHPMEQMAAFASLIVDGALERHPAMRVALLESGTAWLPYWLVRLDQHRDWMRASECAELSLSPSEYFARQCVICSDPEDRLVGWTAARVGAQRVLWASDFPHPDAEYPGAVDEFLEAAAESGLAGDDLRTVLWDASVRFYRLEGRLAAGRGPAPAASGRAGAARGS